MKKEKIRILITSAAIFIACLIIFRTQLFEEKKFSYSSKMDNMINYFQQDDVYVPANESAVVQFDWASELPVNKVEISFAKPLGENASIQVVGGPDVSERYLYDRKNIRGGYKKLVFYSQDVSINSLMLIIKSADDTTFIDVPADSSITVSYVKMDIPRSSKKIILLLGLLLLSMVVALLIEKINFNYHINLSRANRSSNLELLRILCMLFLVAHHFAGHGGLLNQDLLLPQNVGFALIPVGKICFCAYIAISMYFLVDGKYKAERFIRCYAEVLFYAIALMLLMFFRGGIVEFKDVIMSLLVMIGNSHGFVAAYLLFLLIYPFLLKVSNTCTKKQARYILAVLFIIQILSQIVKGWAGYCQPVYSELTLFVFCFFLSLNLKRYPLPILDRKIVSGGMLLAAYVYVYILFKLYSLQQLDEFGIFLYQITKDESSLFYILGGYALFYLFKNIHMPNSTIINTISASTFAVLLIHDNNMLRYPFWHDIVRTQTIYNSEHFIILFITVVFCIFYACIIIDYVRRSTLEKIFESTNLYKKLTAKMNTLFEEVERKG